MITYYLLCVPLWDHVPIFSQTSRVSSSFLFLILLQSHIGPFSVHRYIFHTATGGGGADSFSSQLLLNYSIYCPPPVRSPAASLSSFATKKKKNHRGACVPPTPRFVPVNLSLRACSTNKGNFVIQYSSGTVARSRATCDMRDSIQ
jgi:hypothetical protein